MVSVLHLNLTETEGGAGRAANRLHRGLLDLGVDSKMLVRRSSSPMDSVVEINRWYSTGISKLRSGLDRVPKLLAGGSDRVFSVGWIPDRIPAKVERLNPDILHIHWVGAGCLDVSSLSKVSTPVVWTLHDMWPFTGGCHYTEACTNYRARCGSCPALDSSDENDLSRWVWRRKESAFSEIELTLVAPSAWIADAAASSNLLGEAPVTVIPNGLDVGHYAPSPLDSTLAAAFSEETSLVLFGAANPTSDRRKGFDLLVAALERLANDPDPPPIQLGLFGSNSGEIPETLPVETCSLGFVPEEQLPGLYSAADVMVVPSVQESFGQTASEALACGTPVVAFEDTGVADIVDHETTGYLAAPRRPADLAAGISWVLEHPNPETLREDTRAAAVRRFDIERVAERHRSLYRTVLSPGDKVHSPFSN